MNQSGLAETPAFGCLRVPEGTVQGQRGPGGRSETPQDGVCAGAARDGRPLRSVRDGQVPEQVQTGLAGHDDIQIAVAGDIGHAGWRRASACPRPLPSVVYNRGRGESRQHLPQNNDHPDRLGVQRLRLYNVIWNETSVAKIAEKHAVSTDEVEEVLFNWPHIRRLKKGKVKGEHLYVAYAQTSAGRYLVVFFIRKLRGAALPISAREITAAERRYFHEQKEAG